VTAQTIAVFVAAALFLLYMQQGREREVLLRCPACGRRAGDKHEKDCRYEDRR
jgi:hypothetical protein